MRLTGIFPQHFGGELFSLMDALFFVTISNSMMMMMSRQFCGASDTGCDFFQFLLLFFFLSWQIKLSSRFVQTKRKSNPITWARIRPYWICWFEMTILVQQQRDGGDWWWWLWKSKSSNQIFCSFGFFCFVSFFEIKLERMQILNSQCNGASLRGIRRRGIRPDTFPKSKSAHKPFF